MTKLKKQIKESKNEFNYKKFKTIDGRHPLQKEVPDSTVNYHVRSRKGGKVALFFG